MTISHSELSTKAAEFISFLKSQQIDALLDECSFRDYNVKLRLLQGALVLYHKPSKNTFSLSAHEYQGDKNEIDRLWYRFMYPEEQGILGLCAYVDGSFYNGKCSWGLVLAEGEEVLVEKSGLVAMSPEESAHQIAGEVTAVIEALAFAQEKGDKTLTVFFDYIGLQHWAQGKWKAQSPIAQYYVAKLMQYKHIRITWRKVAAHTGHPFNNRADTLARVHSDGDKTL